MNLLDLSQAAPGSGDFKPRKLVVVEDQLVAKLVQTVFRKSGYQVVLCEPWQAVALLSEGDFSGVLITNAPAVFLQFADSIPLLYLSSAPAPELEAAYRHCRVVRKPFTPDELLEAVLFLESV